MIEAKFPGKIILSGEHAVGYGCPALATTVNQYLYGKLEATTQPFLKMDFENAAGFTDQISLSEVSSRFLSITSRYQLFLQNKLPIKNVLEKSLDFLVYIVGYFLEKTKQPLTQGLQFSFQSDIPIGCGMGSSAAFILTSLELLHHFFQENIKPEQISEWAKEIENLQHGKSSGLDIGVIARGSCYFFEQGKFTHRNIASENLHWINTGKPSSSTGECIESVKPFFLDENLKKDFTAVTISIDEALTKNNPKDLIHSVRENHRLLTHIGVVPTVVQKQIEKINQQGGAAKICGAGSVRGDHAGIVWIVKP